MSDPPPSKKAKVRHYIDDFFLFAFVPVDNKPLCIECGTILTNDSMKKVKLELHQKSKHPLSVGKDKEYLESKKIPACQII